MCLILLHLLLFSSSEDSCTANHYKLRDIKVGQLWEASEGVSVCFLLLRWTPWPKQLGEERVCLFHLTVSVQSLTEVKAGTLKQELKSTEGCCLLACSWWLDQVAFSYSPASYARGWQCSHYQLLIKNKNKKSRLAYRPVWWWQFLISGPST